MVSKVNSLSEKVLGKKLIETSLPPNKPTGEFIGVEYLHQQSGLGLTGEDVDKKIDEGCYVQDESDSEMSSTDDLFVPLPSDTVDDNTDEEDYAIQVDNSEESVDLCGIPGWNQVDKLAKALIDLQGLAVTSAQAENIKTLYSDLLPYDKKPLGYKAIVRKPTKGRLARSKRRSGHVGEDAMRRCFLSAGAPSFSPSKSRLVEAICIRLCEVITQPSYQIDHGEKVYFLRCKRVLIAYNRVRARLVNSYKLLRDTNFTLFPINETRISLWYKNKTRQEEIMTLMRGRKILDEVQLAGDKLPPAKQLAKEPDVPVHAMEFPEPADMRGLARVRQRKLPETSTTTRPAKVILPMPSPITDASPGLLLPTSPDPSAATQPTAVHLTQPSTDSSDPSAATQSTAMYLAQSSTDSAGLSAATQPTAMFFTQPSVSSPSSPPLVIQFSSVCPSTDHTTCPARVHLPAPSPVTDPCSSFLLPALPGSPAATQPTAMYFTQPSANSSASAPVVVQFSSHTSPPKERVSRTTLWRRKKSQSANPYPHGQNMIRKEYSCRVCGQAMLSEGHTQFRGQRYCPYAEGAMPKQDWLAMKRAEADAKVKAKMQTKMN